MKLLISLLVGIGSALIGVAMEEVGVTSHCLYFWLGGMTVLAVFIFCGLMDGRWGKS